MNKMKKWVVPLVFLALPLLAFAQFPPGPRAMPGGSELTLDKIQAIIETVANFLIVIGVVIAVIFIIWGGLKYMLARGDKTKSEEARKAIVNGVIGAAVVLGVGVILRTTAALVTRTFFGAGQ